MQSAQFSSKSNTSIFIDDSLNTNISIKLRRLKIEESVISKSICKTAEDFQEASEDDSQYSAFKLLLHKLKNSFIDIRDLFEEIKYNTSTQDNLKCLDIDDMKKNMMNMETKIQNFKTYLQTQLKSLQESEKELIKRINQHPNELNRIRRQQKLKKMPYKEIVPSPVRVLINSPFKCVEVQQFQDFIKNSKNRYGGWIPYNHSIFEKLWQKYYSAPKNIKDFEYQEVNVENSEPFQMFMHEMFEKLPRITVTEVVAHSKWYSKYVYLKERQQRALDKWRTNRQIIKQSHKSARTSISDQKKSEKPDINEIKLNDGTINILVSDEFTKMKKIFSEEMNSSSEKNGNLFQNVMDSPDEATIKHVRTFFRGNITKAISYRPSLAYRDSTEQWNNRCNDLDDYTDNYLNIENSCIMKRRVPDWRLILRN